MGKLINFILHLIKEDKYVSLLLFIVTCVLFLQFFWEIVGPFISPIFDIIGNNTSDIELLKSEVANIKECSEAIIQTYPENEVIKVTR